MGCILRQAQHRIWGRYRIRFSMQIYTVWRLSFAFLKSGHFCPITWSNLSALLTCCAIASVLIYCCVTDRRDCSREISSVVRASSQLYKDILIKVSSNGSHQWNRNFSNKGLGSAEDVVATSDGGYALTGLFIDSINGWHAALVKTDSYGNY